MNQLLDDKQKIKKVKQSDLTKYFLWFVGGLFFIDGIIGIGGYIYNMNSTWINLAFSIFQLYVGIKFMVSEIKIGDLILTILLLICLSFSFYGLSFVGVLRNGFYFELGYNLDGLQYGIEYSSYINIDKGANELMFSIDILYLVLLIFTAYISTIKLLKRNRRTIPSKDLI